MQAQPGTNPYLSQSIEGASPVGLVHLLYDGIIRFCNQALEAVEQRDFESAHNCILRCYAIVAELQATLDHEQGGQIAHDLERCYGFVLQELREADISKHPVHLQNCLRVIQPLAEAWREAHAPSTAQATLAAAEQRSKTEEAVSGSAQREQRICVDLTG